MMVVIEEWIKTLKDKSILQDTKKKKLLKQVKVLRDQEKTDVGGDSLASGLGFAEFETHELAMFALHYLNNMQLVSHKGLISDFSLEDARALHKRELKHQK